MAWVEPLSVAGTHVGADALVIVTDASGAVVADANAKGWRETQFGVMGDLNVAQGGTARQRTRAAVLCIREISRLAQVAGLQRVKVEARPAIAALVTRILGRTGIVFSDGTAWFDGNLADLRTAILNNTDADGNG